MTHLKISHNVLGAEGNLKVCLSEYISDVWSFFAYIYLKLALFWAFWDLLFVLV